MHKLLIARHKKIENLIDDKKTSTANYLGLNSDEN